jgi:hypothetical protein
MTITTDVRARVALLVATMALGGCAVGSAYVSAPERLLAKDRPPLGRSIRFEVCKSPDHAPSAEDAASRVRTALSRTGVSAVSAAGPSPIDLTVTLGGDDFDPSWSAIVSGLTFSLVPGYFVQRKSLDVELAWHDAAQGDKIEHLHYEARTKVFIWLPLMLSMDFLLTIDGGWESEKAEDGGVTQMIERLGDDIRARLGRDGAGPVRNEAAGPGCPGVTAR